MEHLTLLTEYEAVNYGPGDQHIKIPSIAPTEEELFNERFGWEFYQALKDDRYTYSLKATDGVADDGNGNRYYVYESNSSGLASGDFVMARDVIYKAIRAIDSDGIMVSNTDYYEPADRFQKDCFNELWERYLRGIIALSVARAGVFSRSYKETSKGAIKQYEEGKSKPLTTAEIGSLKSEMKGDIERMIYNMERFVKRDSGQCFTLYGKLENTGESCEDQPRKRTRLKSYGFTLSNESP